jgi:DNA-binding XRE family transcriptional regulator
MSPEEYRSIRNQLGLTQAGLAARLGVSRRTIIGREHGAKITDEAAMAILALASPPELICPDCGRHEPCRHCLPATFQPCSSPDGRDIILIVDLKCPECHALFGTLFSPTNPPEMSWGDVMCRECKAVWNYSDEIQKTLDSDPIISPTPLEADGKVW